MGLALAHPEQASMHHLEGIRFQEDQENSGRSSGVGSGEF
jgi:hypothetical protein